eukprot:CAMPEP_0201694494 /NCGR_PEP_ID=MMETSP0578-20130828/6743_1 /ASSEMBLY_ACC=CAM_ASM_000663 /TAXON_ID=267565 /ORGANISM="Skeletonema grethea, Strain CCMP 1804" /LENGTH=473 /DNA_ID=CAMNT_0048180181 /DNA_START=49 /DNA_END=1470 /DNA_ORIENTATION=-
MGHPTDIFLSVPGEGFICAICHEVLKGASCFKECGHTFCKECIKLATDQPNPTCPTCREPVHTGCNPNYTLRDIIDKLEVRCPEELEERPAKRFKTTGENNCEDGDGADDTVSNYSGCEWRGTINDLKHHIANECLLATIVCGVEGCKHTCRRKDMEGHRSSQEGIMSHMELKYENKLKAMEMKYESKYQMMNDRIIVLEKKANLCFNLQCSLPQREIKRGCLYCTRCGVANYCSRACQTSDWRNHQEYCNRHVRRADIEGRADSEGRAERQPSGNNGGINIPDVVTRRGGDGNPIVLYSGGVHYRNLLNDAIFRAIRGQIENTGDSDTGAHVNEIYASLRADGFSEVEVSSALTRLSNEGFVYTTIDDNHFNLADTSASPGPRSIRSRYAYGSSLNDAIIRVLRDLGAQSEDGVNVLDIVAELALEGSYHELDCRAALNRLMNEGHIYSTIDDDHFQWSEYPPHYIGTMTTR